MLKYKSKFKKIILIIYLVSFTIIIAKPDISKLKVTCFIRDVLSHTRLNTLSPLCTAASLHEDDDKNIDPMVVDKKSILILYVDKYSYKDWGDKLNTEAKVFTDYMKEKKFDGIFFDHMHRNGKHFTQKRMPQMYTFYQTLKNLNPDGIFGLALPNDDDTLKIGFNYTYLDETIDFYVVQTAFYRKCKYLIKMKKMCKYSDMEKSIQHLQSKMPNLGKVLLTVQVISIGNNNVYTQKFSYSDMCRLHHKRKVMYRNGYIWQYCKDNLKELQDKAMLCKKYKMLGVYVQYSDYDDWAGICGCKDCAGKLTTFPATYVIAAGSQGHNTTMALECTDF